MLTMGDAGCVVVGERGELEGEQLAVPSLTAGTIPVRFGRDLVLFQVAGNRITKVDGNCEDARRLRVFFAADPARCNIAEVGFGCNRWAQVTGNVLEDEKAGFHWAYGRSDHLGGTVASRSPVAGRAAASSTTSTGAALAGHPALHRAPAAPGSSGPTPADRPTWSYASSSA